MKIATIKEGWEDAGLRGKVLGPDVICPNRAGQKWTPVLWDGEEDPDWNKTAGLDFAYSDREKCATFVRINLGMTDMVVLTTISQLYRLKETADVEVTDLGPDYRGPFWELTPGDSDNG